MAFDFANYAPAPPSPELENSHRSGLLRTAIILLFMAVGLILRKYTFALRVFFYKISRSLMIAWTLAFFSLSAFIATTVLLFWSGKLCL